VKTFQKTVLIACICAPMVIGVVLLIMQSHPSSGSAGTVGFSKLGLVRVEGVITESETAVGQLKEFLEDDFIAGVLLRIDSPGGATAPSQEIFKAVSDYRTNDKPIVVSMGNIAASGGYYIACPARRIFADPGTLTGSIGVIMSFPMYRELAKKIGIEMQTFKSGDFKDIASPYRSMTEPERSIIQELLKDTHDQFIDDVAQARGIARDTLIKIADGRIFTGRQAVAVRLVDTIGGYEAALSYLRSITGLGASTRVVDKKEPSNRMRNWLTSEALHFFPHLYRVFSPAGTQCLTVFE
jgi:protease-4